MFGKHRLRDDGGEDTSPYISDPDDRQRAATAENPWVVMNREEDPGG